MYYRCREHSEFGCIRPWLGGLTSKGVFTMWTPPFYYLKFYIYTITRNQINDCGSIDTYDALCKRRGFAPRMVYGRRLNICGAKHPLML